jgi:hypothetical protein
MNTVPGLALSALAMAHRLVLTGRPATNPIRRKLVKQTKSRSSYFLFYSVQRRVMMLRTFQATLLLMPAMAVLTLSTSPVLAVTIPFTNSNQLNLTSRDVLSAVNFYDSTPVTGGSGQQITGTIQGVSFLNLDHQTQTVAGALTVSLPHAGDGRGQPGVTGTITGTGVDETQAENFATALTYWNLGGPTGSLSYSFGLLNANRPVEVQLVGGDENWNGLLDVKIGGISQGTMQGDTNSSTANLLTFSTVTNGLGNLVLDVSVISGNFYGLAGAIVTAEIPPPPPAPEPSSLILLGAGALLVARRRRSASN